MATEILVNDGGAPARILPFTAGSTITAGYPVQMGADAEIDTFAAANSKPPKQSCPFFLSFHYLLCEL